MASVVVPVSGGIDSAVVLKHAAKNFDEVYAMTFDYNQKHIKEIQCAEYQINNNKPKVVHNRILDLGFFKSIAKSSITDTSIPVAKAKDVLGDPQTVNYVPFRNMMMISIACAWAETVGASKVFHGAALVDSQAGYWDGSQEFLDTINKVTALNRRTRISVEAPLIEMSKAQIIRYGIELQVDFSRTWTCYEGKEFACGYCTACSSRIKGFLDNGMKDPVQYERSINW